MVAGVFWRLNQEVAGDILPFPIFLDLSNSHTEVSGSVPCVRVGINHAHQLHRALVIVGFESKLIWPGDTPLKAQRSAEEE